MPSASLPFLSRRVLSRLREAENSEPDAHYRDDYQIARLTVAYAGRDEPRLCSPHVEASYMTLGLHPNKVWAALEARRTALEGGSLGRSWEGVPRKPPRSVGSRLEAQSQRVNGAECEVPAPPRIESLHPSKMATQALASNNSRRESREIRDPRKFLALVDRLGLPPHLRASYKGYYEVSGSPIGPNPQSWKGLRKAARDMGISYRTFKRHHRKFQQLGLLQFAARPNADRRSKTWNFLIDQLEEQAWPDDICPRCRHRHADTECGCKLTPRHWPTKGWVERHCRCVPRPSENRGRKGPQPVPPAKTQVPPAAPPELPPAATSPVPASPLTPGSPAAVREKQRRGTNTTLVGMILDGSRKAERIRKLRAALGIRIAELINGVTWIRNAQGISRPVEEGHPQFRHPLPRDQALRKACEELGITEAEGRLLWQAEGGK